MSRASSIANTADYNPLAKLTDELRAEKDKIIERWESLVTNRIPGADVLTRAQVRHSIPAILEQIAKAGGGTEHALPEKEPINAVERFHEGYNVREAVQEYQILREVLAEEADQHLKGTAFGAKDWFKLDSVVAAVLQRTVLDSLDFHRAQLKSVTDAEAKFWTFLAHDLRGGLNNTLLAMQWVEQSLKRYPELGDERDALQMARKNFVEILGGMEQLLQAERLRTNSVKIRPEPVGLEALAGEATSQWYLEAEHKGLNIEIDIPSALTVQSDRRLLKLILRNLLGNAVKFSGRGTVRVSAATAGDETRGWLLRVADKGRGIPPELMPTLFDAFTHGKADGQTGVGLGLFIAAQAAKAIGARITVESRVNEGSTFTVVLP